MSLLRKYPPTTLQFIPPATSVAEIAKIMDENAGPLSKPVYVMKDGEPVGVITEQDIVRRVIAKGLDPSCITAEQIMTTPVPHITPDTSLSEIAELMCTKRINTMLVLQGDKLVGTVVAGELLTCLSDMYENLGLHKAMSARPRLHLLELLSVKPWKIESLAAKLGLSAITIRHHMEVLSKAGIVEETPEERGGVGRPATFYKISNKILRKSFSPSTSLSQAPNEEPI